MINGASCFSTLPTDKYVNFPAFGLKSIFTCSVLLTDITLGCTQSNFEGINNFQQVKSFAPGQHYSDFRKNRKGNPISTNTITLVPTISNGACVAPAGVNIYVYYYKIRELQGASYNIVKVFSKAMDTTTYQLNTAGQFTVQIQYFNVDDLTSENTTPSVIPTGIAEILEKLFLIS